MLSLCAGHCAVCRVVRVPHSGALEARICTCECQFYTVVVVTARRRLASRCIVVMRVRRSFEDGKSMELIAKVLHAPLVLQMECTRGTFRLHGRTGQVSYYVVVSIQPEMLCVCNTSAEDAAACRSGGDGQSGPTAMLCASLLGGETLQLLHNEEHSAFRYIAAPYRLLSPSPCSALSCDTD
jgi:hypothetical protein